MRISAFAAGLCASAVVIAQEAPSADPIERKAATFTELHPAVKTLELRSVFSPPGSAGKGVQRLFTYSAPAQYMLVSGVVEDHAAYHAAGEHRTIIYDAQQGRLLLVQDTVPTLSIDNAGNRLNLNVGFNGLDPPPKDPAPRLRIDFPSFLRHPDVQRREVQHLGGARYRLIHTTKSGGRMIATVDSSLPAVFTGLELHDSGGHRFFALELQVNGPIPSPLFTMPTAAALRERFEIEQVPVAEVNMRILAMTFAPLGFGDGPALEARYKRDLPKLRELMPMPAHLLRPHKHGVPIVPGSP